MFFYTSKGSLLSSGGIYDQPQKVVHATPQAFGLSFSNIFAHNEQASGKSCIANTYGALDLTMTGRLHFLFDFTGKLPKRREAGGFTRFNNRPASHAGVEIGSLGIMNTAKAVWYNKHLQSTLDSYTCKHIYLP